MQAAATILGERAMVLREVDAIFRELDVVVGEAGYRPEEAEERLDGDQLVLLANMVLITLMPLEKSVREEEECIVWQF